jgi:hypothetical protein
MREVLPNAKLIIVLRNPVTRAYSHYHHSKLKGTELRTFEAAVRADLSWFRERGALGEDSWQSNDHSYIRRGIYAPQVRRLMGVYGGAMLALQSEELFADPLSVTNRVLRFIGLSGLNGLSDIEPKTAGRYDPTIPLHAELDAFFLPYNEELYQLLQLDPWWPCARSHAKPGSSAAA